MSSTTASICALTSRGFSAKTWVTPTVFCAVIAVIAVIPCTPHAENAFRSAWMPAPPPESDPAIDRTRGIRLIGPQASGLGRGDVCAGWRAANKPLELELRQRGPQQCGGEAELPAELVEPQSLGDEVERALRA